MASRILYKASVARDLKKLTKTEASRVLAKVEAELGDDPDKGHPLKGQFAGLFRHRIGEYRVIYTKTVDGVLVLRIAHRKDVYK